MPRRIGKYRIEGTLGSGSSGTVYLALDEELERRVALKELASELSDEPDFLERFRTEAGIMARLSHPNCVQVYDYLEDRRGAYIVSEYVEGASLRAVLDDAGRLSGEQALGVTRGALTGLAHAHELGLVHRDIKPENLLADMEGTSKLADFGQAFFTGELEGGARQVTGTPAYMSPEQVRGEQGDVRSDVYSCGALMYELLAGRPPFIGLSRLAVMRMHLEREPPDLSRVNPRLSQRLAGVVAQALNKEPQDRYQSAGEFQAVLEDAARQEYGARWLKASSIAGLVAAVAGAGGITTAAAAGGTSADSEAEAASGTAEVAAAPEVIATEPEATAPPPPPEAAPVPAAEPALEPEPAAEPEEAREAEAGGPTSPRRGPVALMAVAALVIAAAVGFLLPYAPNVGGAQSTPSPGASPAGATVAAITAHFDDASSTTVYQVQGGAPGATYAWGWLKKPACGSLEADPAGLVAGYSHTGCNQVLEALGLVGVCETTPQGSTEYQRNARFGDGALTAADAAAAGVTSDQFAQVGSSTSPGFCAAVFPAQTAAIVTPVPGSNPVSPAAPSPSPAPGATAPSDPTGALVGTALVGLALLMLGTFVLRRPGGAQ